MRELVLHLLDIVENSVAADANNIKITIIENTRQDRLKMRVEDDGKGMDDKMIASVTDPFFTTRTTRKVGLGIPLLKAAAEACKGCLTIQSTPGIGTCLYVEFQRSHIDRMPLGDLAGTFLNLVVSYPQINWHFEYSIDESKFIFDDELIKKELEGISLTEPVVLSYLRELISSGINSVQEVN